MYTETIENTTDMLRGRLMRYKGTRSFDAIGRDMGLKDNLLARFVRGQMVRTETLRTIEAWCEQEARKNHGDK